MFFMDSIPYSHIYAINPEDLTLFKSKDVIRHNLKEQISDCEVNFDRRNAGVWVNSAPRTATAWKE